MTRAALYLRLSAKAKGQPTVVTIDTGEDAKSKRQRNVVTLDTQETDCLKLAAEHGATVVATLVEYGESAFDRDNPDDRPQYAELCDLVRRKEIDVVIAWHTDRLWRDDLEKALFVRDAQRAGLKLVLTKTAKIDPANADDEFLLSILTAVAKKESADKRRRIRSKMASNAAAGKVHGGGSKHRAFGYEVDRVRVVPAEAAIVRELCTRLLAGETLRSVTAWANGAGSTTTTGREWTSTSVKSIAVSYRYSGQRAVGKGIAAKVVNADAEWPGIVDAQTTDRLRALLLDPARRTNRSARKYLLSGHVKCGACGANMLARPRIRNGVTRRDYACIADPGRAGCGKNKVIAEGVETAISELLVARFATLAEDGAFSVEESDDGGVSIEAAAISAKLATLAKRWANDEFDDAEHDAARAALVERRGHLSAMVRRDVRRVPELIAEYADDPDRLAAEWETMPFDRRRAFVDAFVGEITIIPAPGKPQYTPERLAGSPWRTL